MGTHRHTCTDSVDSSTFAFMYIHQGIVDQLGNTMIRTRRTSDGSMTMHRKVDLPQGE